MEDLFKFAPVPNGAEIKRPRKGRSDKGVKRGAYGPRNPYTTPQEQKLFEDKLLEEAKNLQRAAESAQKEKTMDQVKQEIKAQAGGASILDILSGAEKLSREIIETSFKQAEKHAREIISQSEALAAKQSKIVGIKLGEREVRFEGAVHPLAPKIIEMCKNNLIPLLVGPAGCGKSTMAEHVAKGLELDFGHLCFSAGVSEVWLFGRQTAAGFQEADFSRMFREGGVFLADELDAADANVLLALNTALSSNHLYNPISGQRFTKHKDFVFLGAANTFGKGASNTYTGRNRLDAATLDRFTCVRVDYLEQIENAICPDELVSNALRVIRNMVRDRGSSEVISYRAFAKCYTLHKTLEYSWKDTCAMVFASWSKDLLKDAQNVL